MSVDPGMIIKVHARPAISRFPPELISVITSHIDQPSALALARVSPAFTELSTQRLWRSIDLTLPLHYGERPLVFTTVRPSLGQYQVWICAESQRAIQIHAQRLNEMIGSLLMAADEKRVGLVEEVRVASRPGAVLGTAHVLQLFAPTLRSLVIGTTLQPGSTGMPLAGFRPDGGTYDDRDIISQTDTLDFVLNGAGVTFPALRELRIEPYSIFYVGFLSLLVASAPGLQALHVDLAGLLSVYERRGGAQPLFPPVSTPTRLRRLWLALPTNRGTHGVDELLVYRNYGFLIDRSPALEQASIHYYGESERIVEMLFRSLAGSAITDLHLSSDIYEAGPFFDAKPLSSVKRLTLSTSDWSPMVSASVSPLIQIYVPFGLPNMEMLFLVYTPHACEALFPVSPDLPPAIIPAQAMTPYLSNVLRQSHMLRTTHTIRGGLDTSDHNLFTQLDEIIDFSGTIRSFCHDGQELLHVRLLSHYLMLSDEVCVADEDESAHVPRSYYTRDGADWRRTFVRHAEAVWQDFTDLDGLVVPLDAIERMREVEGVSAEDWAGRGIEVGNDAWKVLEDWRAGLATAEADNGNAEVTALA